MTNKIINSFNKLKSTLESVSLDSRFKGYDPFDGLNSPIIKNTFLGRNRLVRLIMVQFFKRSPINLRPLLGVKKTENPQALAVFLSGYCKLYSKENNPSVLKTIVFLADRIISLRKTSWSGACWSYPFAWQARAFYQPENTPLIIPTAYCFNALLDAYEITKNEYHKEVALSSSTFVLKDLNRTTEGSTFAFSYSPKDNSVVFNASLMASQVLARCYSFTKENHLKKEALSSVQYCINNQNRNGSWVYGKQPFHQWIDSFHTGYNLVCLMDYAKYCDDKSFDTHISNGLDYYLDTFFNEDGFSKYFNVSHYPLDVNNAAQLIVTLEKAQKLLIKKELVTSVINYIISNLQSSNGMFFYQKHKMFTNKIIYLRWSNSWMFNALSILSTKLYA